MDTVSSSVLPTSRVRKRKTEAENWEYITSWLERKYGRKQVPQFERNKDTLKVLLDLAAANDYEDQKQDFLHRARQEVAEHLQGKEERTSSSDPGPGLISSIEASIDHKGSIALNELVETSVVLGALDPGVTDMAQDITDLTREEFAVAEQMRNLSAMQTYLDRELESVSSRLDDLNDGVYDAPPGLSARTDEMQRHMKLLDERIAENGDRLAALGEMGEVQGPRIKDLTAEEESVVSLRESVKALEDKVKAFHGLPPNLQEAEQEYERLEKEYRSLILKRDRMFENTASQNQM